MFEHAAQPGDPSGPVSDHATPTPPPQRRRLGAPRTEEARQRLIQALDRCDRDPGTEADVERAAAEYARCARDARVLPDALLGEIEELLRQHPGVRGELADVRARWRRAILWAMESYTPPADRPADR